MGAIRQVQIGEGKTIFQHDDANDVLHPQWSDIYPATEIDGDTVLRCVIVAHADNWEVGVTEDGRVLLGDGSARVYSMPLEVAKKIDNLLGPAIPDAEVLVEAKRHGRVGHAL